MAKRSSKLSISALIQLAAVLVALLIGVVTQIRDCGRDDRLEELTHQNSSLQHRPLLKVIRNPFIKAFSLQGEKRFAIKDLQPKSDSSTPTLDVQGTLSIRAELTIANLGNALAKIYMIVWTDTTTGADRIRKILRTLTPTGDDSSFFHNMELIPGDSVHIEEERNVNFFSDNTFTMHVLLVYANDFDAIFDTYFWAQYRARPIESLYRRQLINGQWRYVLVEQTPRPSEVLSLMATNYSSKAYSKRESQEIIDYLDRVASKSTH